MFKIQSATFLVAVVFLLGWGGHAKKYCLMRGAMQEKFGWLGGAYNFQMTLPNPFTELKAEIDNITDKFD